VFLDGDNAEAPGCILLPGGDAPEQVVFKSLRKEKWGNLWARVSRDVSLVTDACNNAMLLGDHHEWVRFAANQLMCGAEPLWQAMCAEWAQRFPREDPARIVNPIGDAMRS
jgi:hypothetical protein